MATELELRGRVDHEDNLLVQRTSYFISAHAFLVIAFATLLASSLNQSIAVLMLIAIVAFGLALAYFSFALGQRTLVAISFWKACAKSGLELTDENLRDFYSNGVVWPHVGRIVPDVDRTTSGRAQAGTGAAAGTAGQEAPPPKPPVGTMKDSWPWSWRWLQSSSRLTGLIFPAVTAAFWVALAFAITDSGWDHIPLAGVLCVPSILALFYVTWLRRPGLAVWEDEYRQAPTPQS